LKLIRLNYSERSQGEEWRVEELTFGKFNLVVGRNATGKSRLLRGIARVAAELSGEIHPVPSKSHFTLELEGDSVGARAEWAKAMQYFPFSGHMDFRREVTSRLSVEETFCLGMEKFGKKFCHQVVGSMEQVGYSVADVLEVERKQGTRGLAMIEPRYQKQTAYRHLSQAQQRTLTLLIYLTFLEMEKRPVTVLVDDFAEGLDFERAKRLGKLVLEWNKTSILQLILATNDRYVMNVVPIEHWTVLVEDGTTTRVFNYQNSKQKFDDFKFTGLNNFDFFSMDFGQQERA
jgi:energy-coupling factor transporter ATP-binding protein EcfA2